MPSHYMLVLKVSISLVFCLYRIQVHIGYVRCKFCIVSLILIADKGNYEYGRPSYSLPIIYLSQLSNRQIPYGYSCTGVCNEINNVLCQNIGTFFHIIQRSHLLKEPFIRSSSFVIFFFYV